ncbi:MAG: MFS transporter [Actinobacteria bacterium]|nr:MFS transporter [Actinomycetota bacterium]
MPNKSFVIYPYRWVVLGVFMLINLMIQVLWICFAPITGPASDFYGVSDLRIGFLAMSFMIIYVPLSLPVSWVVDTIGYRKSVSIGAVIMGVFALLRGLFAANFIMVFISTLAIAVAQPFLMNSISTVAARWFPLNERATASGLVIVASFLGIAVGEVVSPMLFLNYGMSGMLMIYGAAAVMAALIFVIFTRDAPPTPPCIAGEETRALMLEGFKSMIKKKDIWILMALFLVGMGVFNGISTWIESIVRPRGLTISQAGYMGGVLLLGGIIGAAIIPVFSDRLHKRKVFLLIGVALGIPGLLGVIYAGSYWTMMGSMFILGFFLMSLAPIGYQYAAEITYPAPEGTSNGLLNLAGQVSVVFIYGMEAFKSRDGSFTPSLLILAGLLVLCVMLIIWLKDSAMICKSESGSY